MEVNVLTLLLFTLVSMTSAQDDLTSSLCKLKPQFFWSSEFRSCLPCKPCVVTLAPCTDTADAICGDAEDAVMDEEQQGINR